MDIRFLGHACFELTDGNTRVLIDPGTFSQLDGLVDLTAVVVTHDVVDAAGEGGDVVGVAAEATDRVRVAPATAETARQPEPSRTPTKTRRKPSKSTPPARISPAMSRKRSSAKANSWVASARN